MLARPANARRTGQQRHVGWTVRPSGSGLCRGPNRELRMKPDEKPTDRATGVLSRPAAVGDEPGITRDRLYGNAHWRGHNFRIVDTGGIIPGGKDFIPGEIFRQARVALDEAAAVIMVVDVRAELAAPDLELARL